MLSAFNSRTALAGAAVVAVTVVKFVVFVRFYVELLVAGLALVVVSAAVLKYVVVTSTGVDLVFLVQSLVAAVFAKSVEIVPRTGFNRRPGVGVRFIVHVGAAQSADLPVAIFVVVACVPGVGAGVCNVFFSLELVANFAVYDMRYNRLSNPSVAPLVSRLIHDVLAVGAQPPVSFSVKHESVIAVVVLALLGGRSRTGLTSRLHGRVARSHHFVTILIPNVGFRDGVAAQRAFFLVSASISVSPSVRIGVICYFVCKPLFADRALSVMVEIFAEVLLDVLHYVALALVNLLEVAN